MIRVENRAIETEGLPFEAFKMEALASEIAMAADKSPTISRLIREGRHGFLAP